ncbi:MAG: helicase-associated domain-containing protein [bacterium]
MSRPLFGSQTVFNLFELLRDTSLEDLYTISKMLGKGETLKSKARLLSELPEKLSNPEIVKKYILSISDGERAVLIATYLIQTNSPDLLYIMKRKAQRYLISLKNRGLVFYIPKRQHYVIPEEILEVVKTNFGINISKCKGKDNDRNLIDLDFAILREMFTLISLARFKMIKTTKAGNIFSNSIDRISSLLEISELPIPTELSHTQSRIAFILEYLKLRGFISVMGKNAILTFNEVSKWTKERYIELLSSILRFYLEEERPLKNISEALTISLLIYLMTSKVNFEVDFEQFKIQVRRICSKIDKGEMDGDVEEIISTLAIFGLITINLTNGTTRSFLPTEIGRGVFLDLPVKIDVDNKIYILPDFTVIASKRIELSLRAVLETFLEIKLLRETLTYRLTRNSAYNGFKAGYSAEGIIKILSELSSKPLPQNIEFSLSNWFSQYKKVSFKKGMFLITENKEVADELLANKALSRYVRDMYMGPSLLLNDNAYDEVVSILEKMGYMPKPIDEEPVFADFSTREGKSINNIRLALEKCSHLGREVYMIYKQDDTILRGYATPVGIVEKSGLSLVKIKRKGAGHISEVPIKSILYISFQD